LHDYFLTSALHNVYYKYFIAVIFYDGVYIFVARESVFIESLDALAMVVDGFVFIGIFWGMTHVTS
jgi:hypothetical protein